MNRYDLIKEIIKNIEKLGIDFRATVDLEGPSAVVNITKKQGAYNPLTATPFHLAHDMIHVYFKDSHRVCDYDIQNPLEKRANRMAIQYLWDLFLENGGSIDYFYQFIKVTDCPFEQSFEIVRDMAVA